MEALMNLVVTPIVEIFKCGAPRLVHRMTAFVHYKKNVEKLRKKVEDLRNTRNEVHNKVVAATRNLELIRGVVKAWLGKVEVETTGDEVMVRLMNGEAVELIHLRCCKGWICCRTRYQIGRDIQKKMILIDKLIIEGKSFQDVSDPSDSTPIATEFWPASGEFGDFALRESTRNEVMAALKDDTIYKIGVYGMGGVGKTTLMKQVSKQVEDDKLFDMVVMTTLSQKYELKTIQGEIAKQLGLHKLHKEDDISERANLLSKRLNQDEERLLLILDDLWTTDLDLSKVGILSGENHRKCCKVIITTRRLDVCNSYICQKNIEIGVLSEEDSWHLLRKHVGDVMDSPTLHIVARKVVKECGGLPIALVVIGRALRNKEKFVWVETVHQLKTSNFTYIDGMKTKVFSSIKLSYDYLENEIIRKCFLLCCLFPKDYLINMDELMMYVMCDDEILEDVETLKLARGRFYMVLDKLVASCLLRRHEKNLDGEGPFVSMHDVVRDVAISIASEGGKGFLVKTGEDLNKWPEKGRLLSTGKCLRLSLMNNKISNRNSLVS